MEESKNIQNFFHNLFLSRVLKNIKLSEKIYSRSKLIPLTVDVFFLE